MVSIPLPVLKGEGGDRFSPKRGEESHDLCFFGCLFGSVLKIPPITCWGPCDIPPATEPPTQPNMSRRILLPVLADTGKKHPSGAPPKLTMGGEIAPTTDGGAKFPFLQSTGLIAKPMISRRRKRPVLADTGTDNPPGTPPKSPWATKNSPGCSGTPVPRPTLMKDPNPPPRAPKVGEDPRAGDRVGGGEVEELRARVDR